MTGGDVEGGNKTKKSSKHVKKQKRPSSDEGDAWKISASKALHDLIVECDDWAKRIKEAREGRVSSVKRPGGPSDVDGCERFTQQMKLAFESADEQAKKKKKSYAVMTNSDDANDNNVQQALFPSSLNETVENILSEAAMMVAADDDATKQEDDKEDGDDDAEEEVVKKLNPRDFM